MTNRAPSILIVEDEVSVSRLMQAVLGQRYDCTVASSLGEALRCMRDRTFDLVLADEGLPDGSGLYLLPLARPTLPILIASGKTDEESARLALSKGAHGYLRKPFNLAGLRSAVESALKQRVDSAA
jgi:two-component system, OmpR family, response regulator